LNAHRFLRRIPLAARGVLYISTTRRLAAIDLKTDTIRWEKRLRAAGAAAAMDCVQPRRPLRVLGALIRSG